MEYFKLRGQLIGELIAALKNESAHEDAKTYFIKNCEKSILCFITLDIVQFINPTE